MAARDSEVDDICRYVMRPIATGCPHGRPPSFDDLWEDDKDYMRKIVRRVLDYHSAARDQSQGGEG